MAKRKRFSLKRLKHLSKVQIFAVVVGILLLGGAAYAAFGGNSQDTNQGNTDNPNQGQDTGDPAVNLNPATPQEKQATEDYKKNSTTPQSPSETTANGKKKVYPVVTSVSSSEVNAYVSGVVEDGGTCTATATSGSQTKTATSTGFANVSTTNCAPIQLSLPSSGWSVVVNYSSASYEGASQPYAY